MYVFIMLSLGCIVISHLVVTDLFTHSLSDMISTLLGHAIFYTEGVLHKIYILQVSKQAREQYKFENVLLILLFKS